MRRETGGSKKQASCPLGVGAGAGAGAGPMLGWAVWRLFGTQDLVDGAGRVDPP